MFASLMYGHAWALQGGSVSHIVQYHVYLRNRTNTKQWARIIISHHSIYSSALPSILTPPSEVRAHCSHVNWRNSPDISCEDISGYDVRLFNPDTGTEVIRRVDARGTFHDFLQLDKDLTEQKSTTVQVCLASLKEGLLASKCITTIRS